LGLKEEVGRSGLAAKETCVRTTADLPTPDSLGKLPHYKVRWRRGDSHYQPFAAFGGERASSDARDFYEGLLADPDVTELEFVRLNSGFWEWHVRPLRRNDTGAWEPD
jgi:hypothetical protein